MDSESEEDEAVEVVDSDCSLSSTNSLSSRSTHSPALAEADHLFDQTQEHYEVVIVVDDEELDTPESVQEDAEETIIITATSEAAELEVSDEKIQLHSSIIREDGKELSEEIQDKEQLVTQVPILEIRIEEIVISDSRVDEVECEQEIRETSNELQQTTVEVGFELAPEIELQVEDEDSSGCPQKQVEFSIDEEEPKVEEEKTTTVIESEAAQNWNKLEEYESEEDDEDELKYPPQQVSLKRGHEASEDYELGEELGRGKFGCVYKCIERSTGQQFAAKFVSLRKAQDREDVLREIAIMSVLQHKRLLQLLDAFDEVRGEMCLITELIEGGELFERIVDDDFELTEQVAGKFMRQICEGVAYMHSKAIVHLDMKPENILCASKDSFRVKLIDFGLARQLQPGQPLRVMFGTPDFAAPEVLAYEEVSLATDMWSVGVICYVLLSGLSPFMGDNDMETMANVEKAVYEFDEEAFAPISEDAKDFIARLLVRNQAKRMRPDECLEHPWLKRRRPLYGAAPPHPAFTTSAPPQPEPVIPVEEAMNQETGEEKRATVEDGELKRLERRNMAAADFVAAGAADVELEDDEEEEEEGAAHRRQSIAVCGNEEQATQSQSLVSASPPERSYTLPLFVSLDKRNLKRYVVRRKWHRSVHAIMALGRMGALLNRLA